MSEATPPLLPPISGPNDFATAFAVSPETLARLVTYVDCLALWQPRINLVAPSTIPEVWHRHIADSAQIVALAPPRPKSWADLGSGAGFPGLVAAIMLAGRQGTPPPKVTLVESDQRKCAFLAEVVRRAGLGPLIAVDIHCARIESASTHAKLDKVDVVSARALAPLDKLLGLATPLFGPATVGLFMKGRGAETELFDAKRTWQFACDVVASRTDADARIIQVRGPAVRSEG